MNTCQKPLKKNPRNFVKQQQINQLTKSVKNNNNKNDEDKTTKKIYE